MPLDGHTNQELVNDIKAEIQKLIEQGPTEHELQKVINNIDADFIYPLQSNDGLASQLAYYESLTGDWEYMYEFQKIVHEITPDDIQRVLSKYFNKNFEVSVFYENES